MQTAIRAVEPAGAVDFAQLVRQHQAMVFSIAWHFLHDRTQAEELAQEVFLQLYRALPELSSAEHITHWLRRTAVHRSIDLTRRRKLRPQISLEDVPEPASRPAEGDPMLSRTLRRLVATLPERPRMVMILRFQEDLSPAEIAEALDMPVATVKSHIQRSLALLREKLGRTVGEGSL